MPNVPSDITPTIKCTDLSLGYYKNLPVIIDFNCDIKGPELVLLSGNNGSGKSTFIEGISGYLRPLTGTVEICGIPAFSKNARSYRTVCRSNAALHPHISLHDHIIISYRLHRNTELDYLRERAEKLGILQFNDTKVCELSTGTVQKLWYLICTAYAPPVIVLDEPFNGVDDNSIKYMVSEINRWAENSLVILTAHIVPENLRIDSKIVLG